jgi:hypothetical protein
MVCGLYAATDGVRDTLARFLGACLIVEKDVLSLDPVRPRWKPADGKTLSAISKASIVSTGLMLSFTWPLENACRAPLEPVRDLPETCPNRFM